MLRGSVAGVWTEPNSIIAVRAGAVRHRVTPIRTGERSILKLVYTETLARAPGYEDNLDTY